MRNGIMERRKHMGLTQTELAQMSGVSRMTIYALEHGKCKNTTLRTLNRIASVLGCTVDSLFF